MGDPGSLLGVVIVLVIIGVGLYLLETRIPMNKSIKILIEVIVVLFVVMYLLRLIGIVPKFG
jgi:hypothetical protein